MPRYWVIVRPTDQQSQAAGPYTLYKIRLWVAEEVLSSDVLLCKEGDSTWIKAKDLPKFYDFPVQLRRRLEYEKSIHIDPLSLKPATDEQLEWLTFMRIPFSQRGLTRHQADKLIKGFAEIDPKCYPTYLNCPPTPEIIEELKGLGETDANIKELSLYDARDRLDELRTEKEEERKEAEEWAFDDLEGYIDECYSDANNWYELGYSKKKLHIRQLNKTELQELKTYLKQHIENWQDRASDHDYVYKLIPRVFPQHFNYLACVLEDWYSKCYGRVGVRPLSEAELWAFKVYLDQNVENWQDRDIEYLCRLVPKVFPHHRLGQTGCLVLIGVLLIAIVKSFMG